MHCRSFISHRVVVGRSGDSTGRRGVALRDRSSARQPLPGPPPAHSGSETFDCPLIETVERIPVDTRCRRPTVRSSSTSTSPSGLDRAARRHRRHAGDRSVRHREDHEPTPKEALTESIVWVMCGLAFSGVIAVDVRRRRVRRVHQRLSDREVAQRRQRVRVVDDVRHDGDPAEVPAPGAVLGHLRCAHPAADLHRARQRADQPVLVVAARLRRVPRLHRRQDHPPPRRRRRGGSHARPRSAAQDHAGDRRVRRPQVLHHASTASGPRRRCSPRSSSSRSPTSSSPSTRCRRSWPCRTSRSSCSPRTRSPSSACGRCTSCSPTPRSGSTTCRTRSAAS